MVGIGTESSKGADWVDWLDGGGASGGAVVDKRVGEGEVETKGTRGWRERRGGRCWSWRSELRGQEGARAEDVKNAGGPRGGEGVGRLDIRVKRAERVEG